MADDTTTAGRMTRSLNGVSTRDIARATGVSQSTVSRALRDDRRISSETRARVAQAAAQLSRHGGARVDSPAVGTRTVGVVVADIKNPFYAELLDVLQTELSFLGLHTVLINQRSTAIVTPTLMKLVEQHSVDGLLLAAVSATWDIPPQLSSGEVPTVLLNRLVYGASIDSVTVDNFDGGRQAAEYLLGLGHRHLGLVGGPLDSSTHRDRGDGFREVAAARADATLHEVPSPITHHTHDSAFQAVMRLLQTDPDVTAVFCSNDLIAFGALSAAKRSGRSVPEALSILGFDDLSMSAWDVNELSTIHHPFADAAKAAAVRLADLVNGAEGPAQHLKFPVHVVARGTTAAPAKVITPDPAATREPIDRG